MNRPQNNWAYANVSDFGKLIKGISYKKEESRKSPERGYKPILRSNNINYDLVYVPEDKIDPSQFIKSGDIIFAMSSGSKNLVGKSAQSTKDYDVSFGAFCSLLRISKLLNTEYIGLFFKSNKYRKYISNISKGTNINNLKREHILQIKIPLPPLNEQTRIVEKIEELFSELDKATEDLQKVREQLKVYRQSVLKAAFEGKLTEEWRKNNIQSHAEFLYQEVLKKREEIFRRSNQSKIGKKLKPPKLFYKIKNKKDSPLNNIPKSWKHIKFINLVKYEENSIKRGPFGSAIKKSFFVENGYKVYEQKNAINNNVFIGKYYIDEKKYRELEQFSIKSGDFIVSCSGTIGKIAKLPENAPKGIINQALLKLSIDKDLFIDKLFLYLFGAEFFQSKILKDTRGSAMKNLASVEDIKNIDVLLPPKEEQEEILQEMETRLSICNKIEESVESGLKKIEHLRQSILKRAFEGKLVPQWTDLPAPQPGKYWVYVVKCNNDSNYIGFTSNLRKRWKQHLNGDGADWTKRYKPKYLMYWEEFDNQEDAVIREKQLKTGYGRKWIKREEEKGRLWRAGETAEELLEQIKIEKEKIKKNAKKKVKA